MSDRHITTDDTVGRDLELSLIVARTTRGMEMIASKLDGIEEEQLRTRQGYLLLTNACKEIAANVMELSATLQLILPILQMRASRDGASRVPATDGHASDPFAGQRPEGSATPGPSRARDFR